MSQQDPAVPANEHAEALGMNQLWDTHPELRERLCTFAPFSAERNGAVVVAVPAGRGILRAVVVAEDGEVTPYPDS